VVLALGAQALGAQGAHLSQTAVRGGRDHRLCGVAGLTEKAAIDANRAVEGRDCMHKRGSRGNRPHVCGVPIAGVVTLVLVNQADVARHRRRCCPSMVFLTGGLFKTQRGSVISRP